MYSLFFSLEGKIIENKRFDKEYSTSWTLEQLYLKERGINYSFVKTSVDGITIWKYTKNENLFRCLADFYAKMNKR